MRLKWNPDTDRQTMEPDLAPFASSNDRDDDDDDTWSSSKAKALPPSPSAYDSRKPAWWRRLSNTRPTKAQRRAMHAMDAQHRFQRHPGVAYGTPVAPDWEEIFGPTGKERKVWIELGCGKGDNVLALAHQQSLVHHDDENSAEVALIGAEIHPSALGNFFSKLNTAHRKLAYWQGYTLYGDKGSAMSTFEKVQEQTNHAESAAEGASGVSTREASSENEEWGLEKSAATAPPYQNVRVFKGNGMKLLTVHVADSSVDRLLVTFPDPFFQDHHVAHRLFQPDNVREFHRVLVKSSSSSSSSSGFLCLATDHDGYFDWARQQVEKMGSCWELVSINDEDDRLQWLPAVSTYEAKGWREGRRTQTATWKALPPS